jgi:hypothetical protein
MMLKKLLIIIGLLFLTARADAVVFNSSTMINIAASPYNAVAASTSNLLLNGSSPVWSNGSPGYDTLTVDANYKDIDALINTAGTSESCHSNTITVSNGQLYLLKYTLVNNSGQVPTLTGTGGFPATTLTANPNGVTNYIGFTASGTSLVLTLTNTAAGNNVLTFSLVTATDNTTAVGSAVTAAASAGQDVYVPPGIFVTNTTSAIGGNVRFVGQSTGTTIWTTIPSTLLNIATVAGLNASPSLIANGFKDITIVYYSPGVAPGATYLTSGEFTFDNSVLVGQPNVNYVMSLALPEYLSNSVPFSIRILGSAFHANNNYMPLSFYQTLNVLIDDGCTFDGYSSQGPINFQDILPGGKTIIRNFNISGNGSTTAIYMPTNRQYPAEGIEIENFHIGDISQEAIAFDGLGNNSGACPVIANGSMSSVSNDANGRLVIGCGNLVYYGTAANQAWTVSAYVAANAAYPLTNFYATLGQGSGQEGTIAKIYSYNSTNNTVTLNCFIPAANVTTTGDFGIQSGFFNCSIRNGTLENCGTAVSLYLGVFNSTVEKITAIGCNNGIQVMGGLMLSTYYTLAYNNLIQGNTFINCGSSIPYPAYPVNGAVSFFSDYTTRRQYGNRFVNNIIRGGAVNIASQGKFTWAGNQIDPGTPVNWTP